MKLESEFIRLPVSFDTQRLVDEVSAFAEADWRPHPTGFRGNSSLVLISRDGGQNDDMAGVMQDTPFLRRCPYIRQVMATFGSVIGRSRLMRLDGGCEVSEHSDINYHWYNRVRIHVPVITWPEVRFHCGDKSVHMAAGEAWIFDSWQMHRVVNPAAGSRIHLVIDTSGSPAFWDMVAHGRTVRDLEADGNIEERHVSYDRSARVNILTERYNAPVVMAPGELDALLLDLLADVTAMPGMAQPAVAALAALVHEFRRGWRMVWVQHGATEAGWHHYRQLLMRARQRAAAIEFPLTLASNGAAAIDVLHARVLLHALNPEFAAGKTAPAPIAAQRRQAAPRSPAGVSRNALCPCGSGKKYKRCHGA